MLLLYPPARLASPQSALLVAARSRRVFQQLLHGQAAHPLPSSQHSQLRTCIRYDAFCQFLADFCDQLVSPCRPTHELVAIKTLPRGDKVDKTVKRELHANITLLHPHIVRCRNLYLTDTDLVLRSLPPVLECCSKPSSLSVLIVHLPILSLLSGYVPLFFLQEIQALLPHGCCTRR